MKVSVEALSVLLQHPVISADQRTVCTLLKINTAWRAAVQQSALGLMDEVLKILVEDSNCREFAEWLPKYSSLLRSLTLIPEQPWEEESYESFNSSMQPALELSIQLAAMTAAANGTPQAFTLHEFASHVPLSARTLSHLSATYLTNLVLNYSMSGVRERVGLGSAVQHFTNLQSLQLDIGGTMQCSRYVPAIGQLPQLTNLQLSGVVLDQGSTGGLEALPSQVQDISLQLHYDDAFVSQVSGVVDLRHMKGLHSFMLLPSVDVPEACMLPTQLTSMHIDLCEHTANSGPLSACQQYDLAELHHLQRLVLRDSADSQLQLQTLTALRQLQELQLSYAATDDGTGWMSETIFEAAPMWQRLPNLCSLEITWGNSGIVTPSMLEHLLHEIGAVTSLTTLVLEFSLITVQSNPDEQPMEGQQYVLFRRLRNLQQLRQLTCQLGDLCIQPGSFMTNDALHLTALQQLTRLIFSWANSYEDSQAHGLDPTVMSAIALQMPQLQWLDLSRVRRSLECAIPSFGMLRKLQHLEVPYLRTKVADQCLDYLTHLTKLTHLGGFEAADSARIKTFWSVIRGQHQSDRLSSALHGA